MIMNKKYFILMVISLISMYSNSIAQLPDGVAATPSFLAEIKKNYSDENSFAFDLNNTTTFANLSIQVHIIKNSKGAVGLTYSDIQAGVAVASNYFKPIGIGFFVDSIDVVNDYNYSFITNDKNKTELLTKHASGNKINLYLADSIQMGETPGYGYTYFPDMPDSNYIFLVKKQFTGTSLTTMLGHFMGLFSTHETLGDSELVIEKNCASSGDFICDTYADPDLFNQVSDTCKYTGNMKDSNGKYYVPSVANIMSNSKDECKCLFTTLQYRRMYYYFRKYRQYLR
jgi:hypothetical protein